MDDVREEMSGLGRIGRTGEMELQGFFQGLEYDSGDQGAYLSAYIPHIYECGKGKYRN